MPAPPILAFIVEDDPFLASLLEDLLRDHHPNIRVAGHCSTVAEALKVIPAVRIDLLFLDVELPDGRGFDILAALPEVNFEVIVTTAHSTYAMDAIRHSALDYLLKPVNPSDLEKALERFRKRNFSAGAIDPGGPARDPAIRKLPLPAAEGYVFVNVGDIVHAEADRAYAVFSLRDGRRIVVSKPLGDFEERLPAHSFFRVHNSHIVNLHEVGKYIRGEGGQVVMSNGDNVPVSRSRKEDFLRALGF